VTIVAGVHGVATPADVGYGKAWAEALSGHIGDLVVDEVRWDSTGTLVGDVRLTLTNKRWRNRQIDMVCDALRDGIAHKMIIAHSMGTVFVAEALRRMDSEIGTVFIGSPLNHPVWKNALRTVGVGGPTPGTPQNFWNEDDMVASGRFLKAKPPQWCKSNRVAVAGRLGRAVEHDAELYLANRLVAETVGSLCI